MKNLSRFIVFYITVMLCACQTYKPIARPSVIDENRIKKINVKCRTFDNSVKTIKLNVLDVTANSVKKAFNILFHNKFPIYAASCYENRLIVNDNARPSLHAYGAAIDINYHMNPYFNVLKGKTSIIPKRFANRTIDKEKITSELNKSGVFKETELDATINAIIQKSGSDDWFINREVYRQGMLTKKEVEAFEKNGFTIWGGSWKEPMDFMHFQIPRKLAEILATKSRKEGKIIWRNHLLINKCHLRLMKKIAAINKKKGDFIWKEHLNKCLFDKDYLAAANDKKTTLMCLKDCKRKCRYVDSILVSIKN